jgi:glycosyltransferase involved in cell wall biosynthesis
MMKPGVAILHYSAPPIIGGVEAVLEAHARLLVGAGYPVAVVAGRGETRALPVGVKLIVIPEFDSQHPEIIRQSAELESGNIPVGFEEMVTRIERTMTPELSSYDAVIVHNIFTKHFNLPLTAALVRLLDQRMLKSCIAWCHDSSWSSPHSRSKVHPGYPWDLLRTYRPDVMYITVSRERQQDLAGVFGCPAERIEVIYNGVDPEALLGLSADGSTLARRLGLFESDLILLMPVRITRAKNIEFALDFLRAIKQQGADAQIVLTGPPDPHDPQSMAYYNRLLDLRRELGLEREMRFVYESGPTVGQPFMIGAGQVGELYRLSDALFMPSHREGFGMPVLEAGLAGIPVISRDVPAAVEIARDKVLRIGENEDPPRLARRVIDWATQNQVLQLRRRVRQDYTWEAIFRKKIEPLISNG